MDVKICGITTLEDAKSSIEKGADYLGIVLAPGEHRCLDDAKALQLIEKLKDYPVYIVGIFAEEDYAKLAKRAESLTLDHIQIRAPAKKSDLHLLNNFKKFLVVPVNDDGSYKAYPYSLDVGDKWLYDSKAFGQGKKFDWSQFRRVEKGPFLVAGGLNPHNVKGAIEMLRPVGVDVSSGVCNHTNIKKDPVLMKQFIENAKGLKQ